MIAGAAAATSATAAGMRVGEARLHYRRDIDGLRALAVIPVLVFHAFPRIAPGGFVGVDIFFVISGYLISRIVLVGIKAGTFSFANFYAHRARRIFPSLFVILIAALGIGWFVMLPSDYAALCKHVIAGAGFGSNLLSWYEAGYFDPVSDTKPLLHLWSLGIEEQFYIVWPLLLFAAAKLGRRHVMLVIVIAATLALSLGFSLVAIKNDATMAFYSPLPRAWELGVGALLASWHVTSPRWNERRPSAATDDQRNVWNRFDYAGGAGFLMIVFAIAFIDRGRAFPGWWALLPTIGSALLIGAGPDSWINRHVLSNQWAVFIGLISYQLYLWHWPLLVYTRFVTAEAPSSAQLAIAMLTTFPLAWATYRWVDLPMRQGGSKFAKAIMACAALAVVAVAGWIGVALNGLPGRFSEAAKGLAEFHYNYATAYREGTCFLRPEQAASDWHDCTTQGKKSAPSIWLWGDSHAAHLYPGLRFKQLSQEFTLIQITASSCPPILDFDPPGRPHCREINEVALAEITASRPDVVILSALWEAYDWRRVADTVERLHRAGIRKIVVVGPVPTWAPALPRALFEAYRSDPLHRIPYRLRHQVAPEGFKYDGEMQAFVRGSPATYISVFDIYCNADGCMTRVGDEADSIVAWDSAHLTSAGSKYLVSHFPPEMWKLGN